MWQGGIRTDDLPNFAITPEGSWLQNSRTLKHPWEESFAKGGENFGVLEKRKVPTTESNVDSVASFPWTKLNPRSTLCAFAFQNEQTAGGHQILLNYFAGLITTNPSRIQQVVIALTVGLSSFMWTTARISKMRFFDCFRRRYPWGLLVEP